MAELTMSDVAKIAAEIAAAAAIEHVEKREREKQKKRHDWRLRNTKLLLRNYRSFVSHCEEIKLKIDDLDPEVLNQIDSEEFAVESVKRSKLKTLAIVDFIQQMMQVYRIWCEKSNIPEEMRRYKTVEMMYILAERLTADEIAARQNIERRTVYKDINRACETLSVLMFGVDGARFVD